jgi:malate dehydrogenase
MIIGREAVEAATGPIDVGPGDVVTPLGRDRAAELGIELRRPQSTHSTQTPQPHQPRPAPQTQASPAPRAVDSATLNALYRRGAPVAAPLSPVAPAPAAAVPGDGRPRVAVLGAGHVGSITTSRLAESGLFGHVALIDVVEGLAAGVALDLWHGAALGGFDTLITGSDSLAGLAGADYVVLTAGRARKPGMTRTDLTQANAEIVGPLAEAIARHAPSSVIVVVTNPLEEMTHLTQQRSGFPAARVLGMAGVLDTARFAALVGLTGVCRPDEVVAYALGSHGPEMVIPLTQASARGRPLTDLLDGDTLAAITDRTRDSGAEVVSLLKTGSAYFAPGQSAARMVAAMASGSPEIMACAVVPEGQYGLRDTRVGLPARLGPGGLAEIVTLDLDPAELTALQVAADRLRQRIQQVG